jgi:lipoprotein-anchoring transpeptidase ErfK/SrfK
MRHLALLFTALVALILSQHTACAGVVVQINKFSQRMTVSVDGRSAYVWPVSTGRGGFGTPAGRFRPQWLARRWFSTKYYGSPMPHSIFFHKGYAIHGTNYISRLGGPASHGCVRLHPAHASTLFALVQRAGLSNTSIVISGANPAALAKRRARSAQATY